MCLNNIKDSQSQLKSKKTAAAWKNRFFWFFLSFVLNHTYLHATGILVSHSHSMEWGLNFSTKTHPSLQPISDQIVKDSHDNKTEHKLRIEEEDSNS